MIYGIYSTTDNIIRYIGRTDIALDKRLYHHKKQPVNPGMRCFVDFSGDTLAIRELTGFDCERTAILHFREQNKGFILNRAKGEDKTEQALKEIVKRKPGRPKKPGGAMTATERTRNMRARRKAERKAMGLPDIKMGRPRKQ